MNSGKRRIACRSLLSRQSGWLLFGLNLIVGRRQPRWTYGKPPACATKHSKTAKGTQLLLGFIISHAASGIRLPRRLNTLAPASISPPSM